VNSNSRRNKLTFYLFWYKILGKGRLLGLCIVLIPLILLCYQVNQDVIFPLDQSFGQWLQELQNPILGVFSYLLYLLGDTIPAAFVATISLVVLYKQRNWEEATVLALGSFGIMMLVGDVLKPFFNRERPTPDLLIVDGDAFPSGHATGNFFLYFYLALIVAAKFPKKATYIYGFVTALLISMGLASIYLQVHWFTDVIAGYAFGYLWLCLMVFLLNFINFSRKRTY
jgi:membrane-associated phospholipid phosphatase